MRSILLVDDEREEREGIAWLIERYRYPLLVSQAPNGKKALELLENQQVDILFTDVKMPIMNGLDLAREVNAKYPNVKIIIFSAYSEFDYAKQALEANAVNYLLKPIEVEEFQSMMTKLLQSLEDEDNKRRQRQQEELTNRDNIFYRLLTGAAVTENEYSRISEELFAGAGCRLIHVEFMDNVFEKQEDSFLQLVRMYLGEQTEYRNLFQNEAYLILPDRHLLSRETLAEQLRKLIRDTQLFKQEGICVTVSRRCRDIFELEAEVKQIQEMQGEYFGLGEEMFWTDDRRTQNYYSRDVEEVRKNLMAAVDTGRPELIRKLTDELTEAMLDNHAVSKIYAQNIFYTVISAMYEKNPSLSREKILHSTERMLRKSAKEMIAVFKSSIYEMLEALPEERDENSQLIQRIKKLIETEYTKDIGLDYVAQQVNLAPAYVSYIFKKQTGRTLIKYITELKMEKAKTLLEESNMKIVNIARECGYESPSYFNRAFKNYYGLTPKQLRDGREL